VDLSFVVGSFGGSFGFHLLLERIVVDRNSCVTSCEEVNCHCRIAKVGVMYVEENSSWPLLVTFNSTVNFNNSYVHNNHYSVINNQLITVAFPYDSSTLD